MKSFQPLSSSPAMKALSPEEQKVLRLVRRRRAKDQGGRKRAAAFGKAARHALLIAACVGGLFATESAKAATSPAPVSAPALFDQANADQRAGHLGRAILGYERARILAPRDQAIAQNLRLAQQKASTEAPSIPNWKRPAYWLTLNSLAALASISLLLFCLIFFGTRLIPTALRGFARIAASSLGAITLLAAVAITLRWPDLDRAVIVGNKPVAYIAPATRAAPALELQPGQLVWAERSYGDFVQIRASDGRRGWVNNANVEKIIPSAS